MNVRLVVLLSFLFVLIAAFGAVRAFLGSSAVFSKKIAVLIGGHSFDAEVADTIATRNKGLSDRDEMAESAAMLFVFNVPASYGFWMKDMRFPIDIIWIRSGKIIGLAENVQPEPDKSMLSLKIYNPPGAVDRVLEVNAGLVEKYGLKTGDEVSIVFGE